MPNYPDKSLIYRGLFFLTNGNKPSIILVIVRRHPHVSIYFHTRSALPEYWFSRRIDMSDQVTLIDVDTDFGNLVVHRIIGPVPDKYDIIKVRSWYEVLVDDVVKHTSYDPEDIMRALGHYLAGLS